MSGRNFGNDPVRFAKAVAATRQCSICGRHVRASMLARHENRHQVESETKPCIRCGTAIQRHSNYGQRQWDAQRYCSQTCRAKTVGAMARTPLTESFVLTPEGCWEWTRTIDIDGYGKVRHPRKRGVTGAHRMMWMELVGPIPDGLALDHLCLNRRCVNPAHLEPVTTAENNRRAAALRSHCRSGHPLDGMRSNGFRYCRTCHRDQQRRYLARRGEAADVHAA